MPAYCKERADRYGWDFQIAVPVDLVKTINKGLITSYMPNVNGQRAAEAAAQPLAARCKTAFAMLRSLDAEGRRGLLQSCGGFTGLLKRIATRGGETAQLLDAGEIVLGSPTKRQLVDVIQQAPHGVRVPALFQSAGWRLTEAVPAADDTRAVALIRRGLDTEAEQIERASTKVLRPLMTFDDLFTRWRDKKQTRPDGTTRARRRAAGLLNGCFGADQDCRGVTRADAKQFAQWLNKQGVKSSSQAAAIEAARSMYATVFDDDDDNPINPFAKTKPAVDHESEGKGKFTLAQLRTLHAKIIEVDPMTGYRWGDTRQGKRHEAALWLVRLAVYTGGRIGELSMIKRTDVHFTDDIAWLALPKTHAKHKKPRTVPLHPEIGRAFHDWAHSRRTEDVFGVFAEGGTSKRGTWIVSHFLKLLKTHAKALDIEIRDGGAYDQWGQRLSQHCFRHTFESLLISYGGSEDARRLITGHAGEDVDTSVYATEAEIEFLYREVCKIPFGLRVPSEQEHPGIHTGRVSGGARS